MRIPSGKTDQNIYFVAVDASDYVTRETALATFTVYRSRNGVAEVAYTTPTVTEIDAVNMPGVYALLIDEDTTIASTSDSEEYCVHITHAGMAPVTRTIELYRRDTTSGQTIDVASGGVEVGSFQAGAITAAAIATDAIDADAMADGAITAATFAAGAITATVIATDAIDADAVAAGAITSDVFASGAITADAIAADAIGASELAADAVTEIANAVADTVWDEDATGHQTQGTFGQAIGDPVADTNTIYKAVVTDATGATVGIDVVAVKSDTAATLVDTNELQTDWTNGGRLDLIIDDILLDTAEIGAAGAGLTNINLPNQTMDIVGNITGNLSGSVGSVTGSVGSVTGAVGSVTGNVTGSIGSLATQAKADVNAEVVDALATDTYAEPGQGSPAATASLSSKLGYLYKAWRNKTTQTSAEYALYADDGTTKDQEAAVTDDGTTFTRAEISTGA